MSETPEQSGPEQGEAGQPKMTEGTPEATLPIGTVEDILAAAPGDLVQEVIDVPEWGCSLKLQSLTAAQAAAIKSVGLDYKGEDLEVGWAAMEKEQFIQGVVEPSFTPQQVNQLYATSGRGFARVLAWLDAKSSIDKEALQNARAEFRESQQSTEV